MNVLMLNGSAKPKGCTYTALEEIGRTLAEEGVSYEIFQLGPAPIRDWHRLRPMHRTRLHLYRRRRKRLH